MIASIRFVRFLPVLLIAAIFAARGARATEPFPFGSELMLDAAPLPGSKRVPMLQIEEDGAVSIDLWCTSLRGQASVGDDSIAIVPGEAPAVPCTPQRQASDAALLAALAQATRWRRSGDLVELSGGATLRFRLMTN